MVKFINQGASSLITHTQSLIDRIVSPKQREQAYRSILSFAQDSPIYFIFFALQVLLASFPLLLFTAFTTTTLLLCLSAAIIISFFWIGIAICVLVSTLLITATIATFLFSWIACSFLVGRWIYRNTFIQTNDKRGKIVVSDKKGGYFGIDRKNVHGNGEMTSEEITTAS